MSLFVFAVVLLAAAIHAGWNGILKGAGNALMTTVLVAGLSGGLAALVLPFVPAPAAASLPYLAASVVVQIGYYVLLANAYRTGDMSRTYPIMRGAAPLILVIPATLWFGEAVSAAGWAGIGLVSLGILSLLLARPRGASGRVTAPGTGYALLNAVVIAGYTLIDGIGVRAAGSPAYALWLFVLTGAVLVVWALVARRAEFLAACRGTMGRGLAAGIGNLASYSLVLWAMTGAPIPVVAALRETSILFGTAIAGLVLKESINPWRIVAVLIVAAGAFTLRLA